MFYLTIHSKHFIYGYKVKDPFRQRERKAAAATTWTTLYDYQQGVFYMHHPTDAIERTTSRGALAGTRSR